MLVALLPVLAFAEPPSAPVPDVRLAPYFEHPLAGIALRPPEGSKEIVRAGNPDDIVTFVHEARRWTLKVSRARFSQPVPLTSSGPGQSGLLEVMTAKLKEAPSAEVLRSDVTNVKPGQAPDTAMIAVRFIRNSSELLAQQAVIQAFPTSQQVYYVVELESPGSKPGTGPDRASPEEREAVAAFTAVLDSVKILDRRDVREEQDERLIRTRGLMVNWTPARVRKSLTSERWLRLIHDGKDIGYSYVVEEESEKGGKAGVTIGVRSRTMPQPGVQVDAESLQFVSFDRRLEEWSNVSQETSPDSKEPRQAIEIGSSVLEERRVLDPDVIPGEGKDQNQPGVRKQNDYKLTVTYSARAAAPVQRDLPPFYLPQAFAHLLPRLVPLNEPKTYLFASYVNERREVMMRYVDVLPEAEVTLAGRKVRAVTISERVGLQGPPTLHYMTRDGEYLGSVNEAAKVMILPTDAATLTTKWADANLSRPKPPPANAIPNAPRGR